jgi:hypothetical protein
MKAPQRGEMDQMRAQAEGVKLRERRKGWGLLADGAMDVVVEMRRTVKLDWRRDQTNWRLHGVSDG